MTRSPHRSSRTESLKKEAKQWLKALRSSEPAAQARFAAALPEHRGGVTLRTVQLALARERGFAGWKALLDATARELELREVANEMLRHAIFKGEPEVAARLFSAHPDVAKVDLFCAVAAGDLAEVQRRLGADPAAASRAGGPLDWPPLLYLAYLRLPGAARESVEIARALLERGADPNALWRDEWETPFTVLAGVVALGEGIKPPHERADELAQLLLEHGANPFDTQVLYDTSVAHDDTHWLDVLWAHSERRGIADQWRTTPMNDKRPTTWLDLVLSIAVSYGHPHRAEWALVHGARADRPNAYSGRAQREEALVRGNESMAALLERHGAAAAPLGDRAAFEVACRRFDRDEIRRLAARHPEFLGDAEVLLAAARHGHRDLVELLLDLGMEVDIADQGGIRALNHAAGSGAVEVVKLLLERGANVDKPTLHYGGPLGFAAHFGRREAAEVLAPRSRDVHNLVYLEMKDRLRELFAAEPPLANLVHFRSGVTPLFTLPRSEPAALAMAAFLLEHGADPNVRNKDGDTPADDARKRGFESVAELLSRARG